MTSKGIYHFFPLNLFTLTNTTAVIRSYYLHMCFCMQSVTGCIFLFPILYLSQTLGSMCQHINNQDYYYYYYYYSLTPFCRLLKIIYLKQTMFLGHTTLQVFCSYNSWHM